jgi:hypothetical protein
MPIPPMPEHVWLTPDDEWWAEGGVDGATEYVRADAALPSNAALAICETLMSLYGPSGEWVEGEEGTSRLWRMLQVVNGAPRSPEERWAPDEAIMRAFASRMTGRTVEEVTEPLSRFLHQLRFGHATEPPSVYEDGWVRVGDRMPANGVHVLVCYLNALGNARRVRAQCVGENELPMSEYALEDEPHTEGPGGEWYAPAGWYETNDNEDECFRIGAEVTHWMPLPPVPDDAPYVTDAEPPGMVVTDLGAWDGEDGG